MKIIYNATPHKLVIQFDATPYLFPPKDAVVVPDEIGAHAIKKGSKFGLVEITPEDTDAKKIAFTGLAAYVSHLRSILDNHQKQVVFLETQKQLPPVKSPAVLQAEARLPVLEKWLGIEREKIEAKDVADEQKRVEELMSQDSAPPPMFENLSLPDLRKVCMDRGITFKPQDNTVTLLKRLREHDAKVASPDEGFGAVA